MLNTTRKAILNFAASLGLMTVSVMAQENQHTMEYGFNLKNTDGKMTSPGSFPDAKGYIVIFTCNHCPYAVAYEDRIIALHKKYARKGFPVIAINPNDAVKYPQDSYENMQARAKEKKFPFPYLHDETQETAKRYGAARTPHIFLLVKKDGSLSLAYTGAIDDNYAEPGKVQKKYLEEALDALLAGENPPLPSTKAMGCSIKWKE